MIIDAFKNKIFPMVPTGFSEDETSKTSSESGDLSFKESSESEKLPKSKEDETRNKN